MSNPDKIDFLELLSRQEADVEARIVEHAREQLGPNVSNAEIVKHASKEIYPNKVLIKWQGKVIIVICAPIFSLPL